MSGLFSSVLVTCPYNSSHQITKNSLEKHLEKCRKNYRASVIKSTKKFVPVMPCKYNPNEIILAPEILFHEARCPHRKIPSYMYLGLKQVKVTKDGVDEYPYANVELPDITQDTSLYDHTCVGRIIGSTTYGIPIDAASLRYPETGKLFKDASAAAKELAEQKKMEEALRSVEIFDEPDASVPSPQPGGSGAGAAAGGRAVGGAAALSDDEEDWGKTANAPPFNFMEAKNRDKPLLTYPPGLAKAERRRFVEKNSELVERTQKQAKEEEKAKRLKLKLQEGADEEHDLEYPSFF